MNRRSLVVVMPLAAALLVAACGGGGSADAVNGGAVATPAAAAATPAAAAATPAAVDPTAASAAESAAPTAPTAAVGPVDACALLTSDEIATLVKDATATASSDEASPIPSYTCTWNAATSDGMIPAAITLTVTPTFVSAAGSTIDFMKAMLKAEGDDPENKGRVVDGLGDIGVVTSVVKFDAEAKFIHDDALVVLALTREDAPTQQDAVVDLARAVDRRLP